MSGDPAGELIEWHRTSGFDAVRLFNERPDLFRLLATQPTIFEETPLGKRFAEEVAKLARNAEAVPEYRKAFDPENVARTAKQEQSLGLIADEDDED
jgi:hypothetical protein